MTFNLPALKGAGLARRIRGMFNLNDPRWGRGGESGTDGDKPEEARKQIETYLADQKQRREKLKTELRKSNPDILLGADGRFINAKPAAAAAAPAAKAGAKPPAGGKPAPAAAAAKPPGKK